MSNEHLNSVTSAPIFCQGALGGEVPRHEVLEGLADDAPEGVVPVVVGLPADAAARAHLAHHLEGGLVRDGRALLGAQAHGDLAVAAAVGGAGDEVCQDFGHYAAR